MGGVPAVTETAWLRKELSSIKDSMLVSQDRLHVRERALYENVRYVDGHDPQLMSAISQPFLVLCHVYAADV